MNDDVLLEREGRVAVLTLNRPQRLNAFTAATARRMWELLDAIAGDDDVRVVLLTGAGRAFCAGADLKALGGSDGARDDDWGSRRGMIDFATRLRALPQPSIAAVNGVAAGAGFGMALAADLRIASTDASFIAAQIRTAQVPDAGLTWFLPRLAGDQRARALAMLAPQIPAEKAKEWGLIWDVVDDAALMTTATEIARKLADGPTLALARI